MLRLGLTMFMAIAALALAACGSTDQPSSSATSDSAPQAAGEPSVAEKLATLQKGEPVTADDSLVRTFDRQLDALQKKCKDKRLFLSDLTVRAQQLLKKGNVDESLSSVITHVNGSIPKDFGKQPCTGIFAAYVTLRKG